MMLLTSSQVSVAISSFIIFIFTTALFLSGYVLQQQTVLDLRAAIKPQLVRPKPGPDLYLPPQFRNGEYWEARGVVDAIQVVEGDDEGPWHGIDNGERGIEGPEGRNGEEDDMIGATRWQKAAARKQKLLEKVLQEGEKLLAEEERGGPNKDEEEVVPKPKEKPISRAERRRRIKEQILAEGEGEGFKGYRRRMW